MPNIKSAIKRVNVIEKKTLRNSMIKSDYKTAVKKFEAACDAGQKADAESLLTVATRKIDSACSKNIIKKNTASRKKSNLAKKLNNMASSATTTAAAATKTTTKAKAKTTTAKKSTAKK